MYIHLNILWSILSLAGDADTITVRSLIHGLGGGCLKQQQLTGVKELTGVPEGKHLRITGERVTASRGERLNVITGCGQVTTVK